MLAALRWSTHFYSKNVTYQIEYWQSCAVATY